MISKSDRLLLEDRLFNSVEEHGLTGVECYAECKYVIPAKGKPDSYYQHDYDTLMVCSLDRILLGCEGQCDNFEIIE